MIRNENEMYDMRYETNEQTVRNTEVKIVFV